MPPPGSFSHEGCLIRYRSPLTPEEFTEYYSFRWELLRKPLALPCGSERDALEDAAFHIAAYDEQSVVGVGRLHMEPDRTARVRYMAVHASYRHKGIGRSILKRLEQFACSHQVQVCWLHARESAVEFYKKNGYVTCGTCDSELAAVHHERMEKELD